MSHTRVKIAKINAMRDLFQMCAFVFVRAKLFVKAEIKHKRMFIELHITACNNDDTPFVIAFNMYQRRDPVENHILRSGKI